MKATGTDTSEYEHVHWVLQKLYTNYNPTMTKGPGPIIEVEYKFTRDTRVILII